MSGSDGSVPPKSKPDRPAAASPAAASAAERIAKLPVRLSVRVAEKRVELGQVLSLAPGALLTFAKPCDDLLDLYVNNRRLLRGEAVKVGEHYGLRVQAPEEECRSVKM